MKEQLISFKTAKLAKEKGFDLDTDLSYTENGAESSYIWIKHHPNCENDYPRLTQSLLQKWLREKHQIIISIVFELNEYEILIYNGYNVGSYQVGATYKTYEEALEQGLFEALKLI